LFIFSRKKDFFAFNEIFMYRFPRILVSSLIMGLFFYFLLSLLSEKLIYSESLKFIYLLLSTFLTLALYVVISIFTKAFKLSDINLKYK
jgi:putative peptidoglycan lipid II flippase